VTARDVYVSPDRLGLFRVDRKSGKESWHSQDAVHFLATNNEFVYATDPLGRFLVLDYFRERRWRFTTCATTRRASTTN